MRLSLKVLAKSKRSCVAGWLGDVLKVCVTAPAQEGKANAAVEDLLVTALNVPKASVRLVAGLSSPRKIVEIDGLSGEQIRQRLELPAVGQRRRDR
jgi:hypothetical protein